MRYFTFQFKGLALGGTAVVSARTYEEALTEVKKVVPYADEPITCEDTKGKVIPVNKPQIIYFDNGDY